MLPVPPVVTRPAGSVSVMASAWNRSSVIATISPSNLVWLGPIARCGPVRQCAYLVAELEPAVEWWTALGVGPFLAMPEQQMKGYVHRGEAAEPVLTIAFANSGELQIELIVTHDDRPSLFREALDAGHEGAHHLAWWVGDWTGWRHLAAEAGWEPVTYGDGGGLAHFAYYDVGGPLFVEVME